MKGAVLSILVVVGVFLFGCASAPVQCGNGTEYVCGTNNITYQNPCMAQQAGVNFTNGSCRTVCVDSDNGRNLLEAGTTQKGAQAAADTCVGSASVQEYYCENNEVKVDTMPCPGTLACSSGKCAQFACSASSVAAK